MSEPGGSPHPYIPNTASDRALILERLELASAGALFADLPEAYRDPHIELPPALTEPDLLRLVRQQAGKNRDGGDRPSFLGAGAYRRSVPSIVPYLVTRSEFMTAYTPYQPEISQGTLQTAFEYQSVVCELTGLDVSNTGLYDGASATAEACLLAARVTGRSAVALLEPVHPGILEVVRTYAYGANVRVDAVRDASEVSAEHACLVVQQPDFLGTIVDVERVAEAAHAAGALCVVNADPFALGMLRAPGDAGADVVTGEGRDLAGGLQFGGPSLGLFAARNEYLRQFPGRIVGRTRELHGPRDGGGHEQAPRTGYVLTLQAREQFIRRERATSNVSTAQALIALAFTIAVQALGPRGLREAAELCYQRAHEAARRIEALPAFEVPSSGPWFQEFLVRGPMRAPELHRRLAERGIAAGLDVSQRDEPEARDALLFCVTEATPPEHVDALIDALREIGDTL
ncbi:MAG: aminomethyl-transferring glycine dehydrogenase subunit GcvPA [Dehalococcoidia bacterium]|nr:aminomethyl-transferring glycine dehydrogenase subunit GcvPA [Dehalococcoidia bacterium]